LKKPLSKKKVAYFNLKFVDSQHEEKGTRAVVITIIQLSDNLSGPLWKRVMKTRTYALSGVNFGKEFITTNRYRYKKKRSSSPTCGKIVSCSVILRLDIY